MYALSASLYFQIDLLCIVSTMFCSVSVIISLGTVNIFTNEIADAFVVAFGSFVAWILNCIMTVLTAWMINV